jgi:organic radical activating enzyme
MNQRALVREIFFSFQGEGPFVGAPQIFLRLHGCNLACTYCDTPPVKTVRAFTVEQAAHAVRRVRARHPYTNWVSLTGGEPLLWSAFIKALIKKLGVRYSWYLETNGTLPHEFLLVADAIDMVSLDIKLASASGCAFEEKYFLRFLDIMCKKQTPFFLKVIVTRDTSIKEFRNILRRAATRIKNTTLVLQPVTPIGRVKAPTKRQIQAWYHTECGFCREVRIIPQVHRIAGWR